MPIIGALNSYLHVYYQMYRAEALRVTEIMMIMIKRPTQCNRPSLSRPNAAGPDICATRTCCT